MCLDATRSQEGDVKRMLQPNYFNNRPFGFRLDGNENQYLTFSNFLSRYIVASEYINVATMEQDSIDEYTIENRTWDDWCIVGAGTEYVASIHLDTSLSISLFPTKLNLNFSSLVIKTDPSPSNHPLIQWRFRLSGIEPKDIVGFGRFDSIPSSFSLLVRWVLLILMDALICTLPLYICRWLEVGLSVSRNLVNFSRCGLSGFCSVIVNWFLPLGIVPSANINPSQYDTDSLSILSKTCSLREYNLCAFEFDRLGIPSLFNMLKIVAGCDENITAN